MRRRVLLCIVLSAIVSMSLSAAPFAPFKSYDLNGNEVDQSVFQDTDLTMVFAWGTYCTYCKREMPAIVELEAQYPGKFQTISIVTDVVNSDGSLSASQLKKARDILEKMGMKGKCLLPTSDLYDSVLSKASAIPAALFVNKEGEVLSEMIYGQQTKAALEKRIKSYLQ